MKAAGFVLTGGRSSRMQRDKGRLKVGEGLLIDEIATRLRKVTAEVSLVGKPENYQDLSFPCLPDIRPGFGPLSGIETALSAKRAELNVILSCDIPGVNPSWILELLSKAEQTQALCVIARDTTAKTHPLCGVYRIGCLGIVSRALDEGRLRLMSLMRELEAVEVSIDAVVNNLNTPEQFAQWISHQ